MDNQIHHHEQTHKTSNEPTQNGWKIELSFSWISILIFSKHLKLFYGDLD